MESWALVEADFLREYGLDLLATRLARRTSSGSEALILLVSMWNSSRSRPQALPKNE